LQEIVALVPLAVNAAVAALEGWAALAKLAALPLGE